MAGPRDDKPAMQVHVGPDLAASRTYVVLGMPRGGTSLVAGLARLCGLPMGENLGVNHEDPEFNVDVLRTTVADPLAAMVETIARRDAEHRAWGWKYPRATRYLDDLRPHLRNPHLVVVLRDPVAAAGRHLDADGQRVRSVANQHALQGVNLDLVERWQVPTLLVSYERGIARPFVLSHQLADFLGMPRPEDRQQVRAFARPGRYRPLP